MNDIIVGFEFSGVLRNSLIRHGKNAISCDILPSMTSGRHIQADIRTIDFTKYKYGVFFPPCTFLCVSGARWFKQRQKEQEDALDMIRWIMDLPLEKIAIENPIGVISTRIRKPDQIIQPWQFGHGETKSTCLWLKNLPKLIPTNIVEGREQRIHNMPPSNNRGLIRSITYLGIAEAMATQWFNDE